MSQNLDLSTVQIFIFSVYYFFRLSCINSARPARNATQ